MTKIKLGDIFEIATTKGKAYLHYIYNDKTVGDLVRVLPGLYAERPMAIEKLANEKERFVVFFPVSTAYKKKMVHYVGTSDDAVFTKPRFMRTQHSIRGEFLGWHIINTETWHRELVKNLSTDQKQLSPWGIWNTNLLAEDLSKGWSLENWG